MRHRTDVIVALRWYRVSAFCDGDHQTLFKVPMASNPTEKARPDSWQTTPMPQSVARVPFEDSYSAEEHAAIVRGLVPQEMEDKWFIYENRGAVYFHRSWSGVCIYCVRFETPGDRYRIAEVLVNRDAEEKAGEQASGEEGYDAPLLRFLIDNLLLGRQRPFPVLRGVPDTKAALFQHHIAGTGYPTSRDPVARLKSWWRFW